MISILAALLFASAQSPTPSTDVCSASNAVPASVAQIARDPDNFVGRCVTVTAPSSAAALFQDIDAIYLGTAPAPFESAHGERGRIGLYVLEDPSPLREMAHNGPLHLTVTGTVDTCEATMARYRAAFERKHAPNEILIPSLGGYCHWFGGPVSRATSYSVDLAARFERLTGEAKRREVGDLVPATPGMPSFGALQSFAREFADAIRRQDRAALSALHDDQASAAELSYMLDVPDSPFAVLRSGEAGEAMLFARRDASAERGEVPGGVICFCRTADCAGRWPIARMDAGNGPERPYVCTELEPRDWRPRLAGLNTRIGPGWLAEPAGTAFRSPTR